LPSVTVPPSQAPEQAATRNVLPHVLGELNAGAHDVDDDHADDALGPSVVVLVLHGIRQRLLQECVCGVELSVELQQPNGPQLGNAAIVPGVRQLGARRPSLADQIAELFVARLAFVGFILDQVRGLQPDGLRLSVNVEPAVDVELASEAASLVVDQRPELVKKLPARVGRRDVAVPAKS